MSWHCVMTSCVCVCVCVDVLLSWHCMCLVLYCGQFCRSPGDVAGVQSVLGELFVAQLQCWCDWCSRSVYCWHGQWEVSWKGPSVGGQFHCLHSFTSSVSGQLHCLHSFICWLTASLLLQIFSSWDQLKLNGFQNRPVQRWLNIVQYNVILQVFHFADEERRQLPLCEE